MFNGKSCGIRVDNGPSEFVQRVAVVVIAVVLQGKPSDFVDTTKGAFPQQLSREDLLSMKGRQCGFFFSFFECTVESLDWHLSLLLWLIVRWSETAASSMLEQKS